MTSDARELAAWCLTTGQPVASWMVLTELERRVFKEMAIKAHEGS